VQGWFRRLRGALGIGAIWGAAGAMVGGLGGAIAGLVAGLPIGYLVPVAGLYAGATTFLLGAGFSLALTLRASRQVSGRPSTARVAALGALAGAALPFMWMLAPVGELLTDLTALPMSQFLAVLLGASATCGAIGAGFAAATMTIAGRAPVELTGDEESESRLLG
jgi:hypothetical protein